MGEPVHLCTFSSDHNRCENKKVVPVLWPGGRKTPPKDRPPCGFNGEYCRGIFQLFFELIKGYYQSLFQFHF